MKKCFLLFVTVLMGTFSTIATAQTDNLLNIAGLEPDLTGNTTYYLKNVGTGLYMSYGGEWGTHCIETQQAHPIVVEDNGDGTVAIGSIGGYLESNTLWMDSLKSVSKWTLVKVEGYENQYYLYGDGNRVLTSVGNSAGLLTLNTLADKAMQRWIFTNGEDIKSKKMGNASKDTPFDVSVSIRGGAFDLVDGWDQKTLKDNAGNLRVPEGIRNSTLPNPYFGNWENYAANSKWLWDCGTRAWDPNVYAWCGIINGGESALDVTYSMTLPKGTYHFSFEAFYKYMYKGSLTGLSDYGTMDAKVTIAGKEIKLDSYGSDNSVYNNGEIAAAVFRDNDDYKKQGSFYLSNDQQVSIVISKPKTKANGLGRSYPSQIYIDDFTLLYYGDKDVTSSLKANANYTSYLYANIEEYKSQWNEDGQAAFDEIFPIEDVANVITRADYYEALQTLEEARKAGVLAHNKSEAIESGRFTDAIYNHSFELGSTAGWTIGENTKNGGLDTDVKPNDGVYKTSGIDGIYLFNAWSGADQGLPITQTISGLPEGVYKLSVLVASDPGATVYILANDTHEAVTITQDKSVFEEHYVKFEVTEDGTATIGVVGGNNDGSYVAEGGFWWYKCDNFRLEYLGDDHLVLNEEDLTIRNLDEPFKKVTVNRTINANTWSTFVVPFDMTFPEKWEVKKLTGTEYNSATKNITLIFGNATTIEAGEPYMVRVPEKVTEVVVENAYVNTTLNNFTADHVIFVGSYVACNIPTNSYFINSNKFYLSVNPANPDKIRGFRGYFTPINIPEAKSISYRFDDEEGDGTTEIAPSTLAPQPSTEFYDLMGRRVENPTQGIYIVNGKKVVIK